MFECILTLINLFQLYWYIYACLIFTINKNHISNNCPWSIFQCLSIHLLNTRKYCDYTRKYCGNTYTYWANTWKMYSHASVILATILVSFEAILKSFSVRINFKSQYQFNDLPQALKYVKISSKLTSNVTILANIALAG